VAVLPVGSFEQHGDFLPLITDTVVACLIARRVSADYGLFLLPPVTLSCSHEHSGFAGTVSVSARRWPRSCPTLVSRYVPRGSTGWPSLTGMVATTCCPMSCSKPTSPVLG
jgi:Creatinine amidohydrolase